MPSTNYYTWVYAAEGVEPWWTIWVTMIELMDLDLARMTALKEDYDFSATPDFDADAGNFHVLGVLTGNITGWDISGGMAGQVISIKFTQDGTGNRTIAGADSKIKHIGSAYTMTATADKTDILKFQFDGAIWWELSRAQNMG